MADGWGGRRPGAGRKPKLTEVIEAKALQEAGEDAKYALGLIIGYMRNEQLAPDFRKACAELVMDRVWGKAMQRSQNEHSGAVTVSLVEVVKHDGG